MRIALGDAMSASLTSGGLRRGAPLQWHAQALRRLAAGASVVAALGVSGAAAQTTKPAHAAAPHAASNHAPSRDDASHPHVYLMRGLLNIFYLGMDQLAAQIARNGIDASVYNHSVEESVVGTIVQKYRAGDHGPYILVGHSLGADAVMVMAQQLNSQGVPVALVVPFDGTESYTAPANVSCVVNLTQRKYAYMQAGAGFHGKLSNVDVSSDTSIDHVTIDKSPRLQAMALKEIMQAARGSLAGRRARTFRLSRGRNRPHRRRSRRKTAGPKKTRLKTTRPTTALPRALSPRLLRPSSQFRRRTPRRPRAQRAPLPARRRHRPKARRRTAPRPPRREKASPRPVKSAAPEKSAAATVHAETPIF